MTAYALPTPTAKPVTPASRPLTPKPLEAAPTPPKQVESIVTTAATWSVEYQDADGWGQCLRITTSSGALAIAAGRACIKRLQELNCTPRKACGNSTAPAADADNGSAPICAIHGKPMTRVQGAKGAFWSCHEKLADGSYCPFKPSK